MKKNRIISGILAAVMLASLPAPATVKAVNVTSAQEFNGHYYQVITTELKWEQAELQCELKGGHLATITSQEEQDFIYSLTGKDDTWIGGKCVNGKWTWITGEPFSYTNWNPGQPSGGTIYLQFWDGEGKWDDCTDKEKIYVCEWDSAEAYTKKTANFLGKKTYNGHTYKYFPGSYTWKQAKKLCTEYGGYLATITSSGENKMAYSLVPDGCDAWIGLNDAKKEGVYKWVTGERSDYLNFGTEVNNFYGGAEDYFGFYGSHDDTGKWNDFKNDVSNVTDMGFICEWDTSNTVILTAVKKTITVKKGKKTSLLYQVYPVKKKVTFKSSNKKATVTKKGVVKGVKKGTAKITIKAGKKKVVVKVKVK